MAASYFFIHVLLLHVFCGHAKIFGQKNCTESDKEHLPCTVHINSNDDCLALASKYPDLYERGGGFWPAPPRNFNVSSYQEMKGTKYYPKVDMSWLPPETGDLNDIRGFEVFAYDVGGDLIKCQIYNFSGASWTVDDYNLKLNVFSDTFGPGDTDFYLELYSLPKPAFAHDNNLYRTAFIRTTTWGLDPANVPAANWRTALSYNNKTNGEVSFSFALPPQHYNFKRFNVMLVSEPSEEERFRDTISNNSHTFKDVPAGVYSLWVQPFDDFSSIPYECLCKTQDGGCTSCIVTRSRNITVLSDTTQATSRTTTSVPISKPTHTVTTKEVTPESGSETPSIRTSTTASVDEVPTVVAAIVVVFLVILGAVIGFFVYFYWWKQRRIKSDINQNKYSQNPPGDGIFKTIPDGDNTGINNCTYLNNEKLPSLTTKKVNLIYTEDHPAQVKVVEYLANYLQTCCKCDVLFAPWYLTRIMEDGICRWTINSIDQSDLTIIINSEAAHKLYDGWKEKREYKNLELSPLGDMFTNSIAHVLQRFMQDQCNRFIMVYFEYTKEDFLIKDICPGLKYKLMKDFNELLCQIHGLNPNREDLANFHLPLNGQHDKTDKGRALMDAISKATAYERDNPNWCLEKFGKASRLSDSSQVSEKTTDRSRFDSGIEDVSVETLPKCQVQQIQELCRENLQQLADNRCLSVDEYLENQGSMYDDRTISPDDITHDFYPPSILSESDIVYPSAYPGQTHCPIHGPKIYISQDLMSYDDDAKSKTMSELMKNVNDNYDFQKMMEERAIQESETGSLGGISV